MWPDYFLKSLIFSKVKLQSQVSGALPSRFGKKGVIRKVEKTIEFKFENAYWICCCIKLPKYTSLVENANVTLFYNYSI